MATREDAAGARDSSSSKQPLYAQHDQDATVVKMDDAVDPAQVLPSLLSSLRLLSCHSRHVSREWPVNRAHVECVTLILIF